MKCSVRVIAMACVVTFSANVQARIHPYFPYFHVDVLAECVLFKPAAGHILGEQTSYVSVSMNCICSEMEQLCCWSGLTTLCYRWQGAYGQP